MKGDIVLAQELDVTDAVGLPPPVPPITSCGILLRPFLCCCDVSDRRIKPNIEYLLFEAGARHGYPPGKVASNAAVSQICGDPAARQRLHERRPPAPRAEPGVELVDQQRLAQEQVPALAQLQPCVAG